MGQSGISKTPISDEERKKLWLHLQKHKIYPFRFPFDRGFNFIDFPNADLSVGTGIAGRYFTFEFRPDNYLGIVSIATNFIIVDLNTVTEPPPVYSLFVSYNKVISTQDALSLTKPQDEGNVIYQLSASGGAINDFQVFYPLNWYVESNKPIFMHVWASTSGGNENFTSPEKGRMKGHFILGTLLTGIK